MPKSWWGLLVVAGTLVPAGAARAEVVVTTPWVGVQVGRPAVVVNTPWVNVRVGRPAYPVVPVAPVPVPVPAPIPLPGELPPVPVEVPPVVVPAPAPAVVVPAVAVPTVAQFVASFKPCCGRHEVVVLHPFTCAPVKVCFDLPPGSPRKVRLNKRVLEFDYGRDEVVVRFFRDGTVQVRH